MGGAVSRSPLAPETFPALPPLAGVKLATAQAGIKYKGRTDVLMVTVAQDSAVAGVFTRSKAPSAPVDWCRRILGTGPARALIVNSGNANAFTGKRGVASVKATLDAAHAVTGYNANQIYLASTGVIGEPLDASKIEAVLPMLYSSRREDAWSEAASAIMTTDTFPKAATRSFELNGKRVTINGIAKGSGMIAPDMATMLAFIFTDAEIAAPLLQQMLQQSTAKSFNSITVDGDTSTSDTALLFATDYPHSEGTFPFSRNVVQKLIDENPDVTTAELVAVLGGNAARLFARANLQAQVDARQAELMAA